MVKIRDEEVSFTQSRQLKWYLLFIVCCLLAMLLSIWFIAFNHRTSSSMTLPIQNANLFVFLYESNLIDGSSLTIENFDRLEAVLKNEWEINRLSILSAQFIGSTMENFDRLRRDTQSVEMLNGDPLLISLVIEYPSESLISKLINKQLQIPIQFTDGLIRNVNLTFSCDQQTAKGIFGFHQIDEVIRSILDYELNKMCSNNQHHHHKFKRQSDETEGNSSLVDISPPMFNSEVVGHFQLGLQSDTSIIVLIGNDNNLYLSNLKELAADFSLVDLMTSEDSNVALLKDTKTDRYLHGYNDIRDVGYSRVRTHLESAMPFNANLMFWTFTNEFIQFFRGGSWFYDTAACLDASTGLTRIWLINGQQGLTNLTSDKGHCGLARLIPINYD